MRNTFLPTIDWMAIAPPDDLGFSPMASALITRSRKTTTGKPSDSMTAYLAAIAREPLLTPTQEITLGHRVQAMLRLQQDLHGKRLSVESLQVLRSGRKALDKMVRVNLRLVVSISKHYPSAPMERMDLIQEGNLGLRRAVEKFDPERGYRFSTYAYWWIRQSMNRALTNQSRLIRLPGHHQACMQRIRTISRELSRGSGQPHSRSAIAEALNVSVPELDCLLSRHRRVVSLDASLRSVGDGQETNRLNDRLPDPTVQDPLVQPETRQSLDTISNNLQRLSSLEKEILGLMFGLDGSSSHFRAEVGALLGLAPPRCSQD